MSVLDMPQIEALQRGIIVIAYGTAAAVPHAINCIMQGSALVGAPIRTKVT